MESIQNSTNEHSNIKMLIFPLILIVSLCMLTVPLFKTETKSLGSLEPNTTLSPDMYGHLRNLQENDVFDLPTSMNTIYRLNNYHIYKGKWKSEQEIFNFGDIREGQLIANTLMFTDVNDMNKEKIAIFFKLLEGEFYDNWVVIRSQVIINKKDNINTLTFSNITKDNYLLERFYSNIIYGESLFNSHVVNSKY
jgi:hypothetical protein